MARCRLTPLRRPPDTSRQMKPPAAEDKQLLYSKFKYPMVLDSETGFALQASWR